MNRIPMLVVLLLCAATVRADSMVVFGGGEQARQCYTAATLASQMGMASDDDLEACDWALEHGRLELRDRVATLVNRGVVKVGLEEYREAYKDYARAITLDPDRGEPYVNRGNLFFLSERFDLAVQDYTRAIDVGMNRAGVAYMNRGMAHENAGNYGNAEADYRKAIELYPEWEEPREKLERVLGKLRTAAVD